MRRLRRRLRTLLFHLSGKVALWHWYLWVAAYSVPRLGRAKR